MKNITIFAVSALCLLLSTSAVNADSFDFVGLSGQIDDLTPEHQAFYGTNTVFGSATMDVNILSGNKIMVVLDNTSPTSLTDPDGGAVSIPNAPGITGFGLNIANFNDLSLLSWSLFAADKDGNGVNLTSGTEWGLLVDGNYNGIKVDYTAKVQDVKGALYNPAASAGLAALPNYFTTATLTINFDNTPIFDFSEDMSPFVRTQNVGPGGIYSLKMGGTAPVPEPATMLLFGTGLVGLVGSRLRRKK